MQCVVSRTAGTEEKKKEHGGHDVRYIYIVQIKVKTRTFHWRQG